MSEPAPGVETRWLSQAEWFWALALLFVGVASRLTFATLFPTNPGSDFDGLTQMATRLSNSFFGSGGEGWDFYNPGMPVLLSLAFRILPGAHADVARLVTATATGLAPLIPFFVLRSAAPLRTRLLSGFLLALWPGQIAFSGVVAQDNWVVLPTIALGSLCARCLLLRRDGYPLLSAALFALGAYIRQEMIIVLVPLALAAAGLGSVRGRALTRPALRFGIALAALLLAFASQRWIMTGRFALTTEHSGTSLLGAYMPGAAATYWSVPSPYVAANEPQILDDPPHEEERMRALAFRELARRPGYHLLRMFSGAIDNLKRVDSADLRLSLTEPNAMPPARRQAALALANAISGPLDHILHSLHFLCYVPAIGLELLIIALAAREAFSLRPRQVAAVALACALSLWGLSASATSVRAYVLRHDFDVRPTYALAGPGKSRLWCTVENGQLLIWGDGLAAFGILGDTPQSAHLPCKLIAAEETSALALELRNDCRAPCPHQDVAVRVVVDGREVVAEDASAFAGGGRAVPLGRVSAERPTPVDLFIERGRGDARVTLQLSDARPGDRRPSRRGVRGRQRAHPCDLLGLCSRVEVVIPASW